MEGMFFLCDKLASLDLSNFDTSKVKWSIGMFADCTSLVGGNKTVYDINNTGVNADFGGDGVTNGDALTIQKKLLKLD